MLEGPVAPTLVRLAAPTMLVMMVQAAMAALDGYFIGRLGPDALAGVSLVFPLVMLMQTMSAGGMGGGVASAVARALGRGRRDQADAAASQAVLIALAMAGLFMLALLGGGPFLYRAMGGRGAVHAAAVDYSTVIFGGALAFWLLNTLGSIVRGTGNMMLPAAVTLSGALVYVGLAPALISGAGPLPPLGIAGAAVANVSSATLGSVVLLAYLASHRSAARLSLAGFRPRWATCRDILRVGVPGSLNTILTNLTVVLLTGLVGRFGDAALAGYGVAARLEYILIPLVFGFGAALVTMVGTNVGAGQVTRAQRVAWIGAGLATALTGAIGLGAALAPRVWMGIFTADPAVVAVGASYLRVVGPAYAFLGLGLALYFASQGAGRLLWPLIAGFARLLVAVAGGSVLAISMGAGVEALFWAIAAALVVYGVTVASAVRAGAWQSPARRS
jgi:putative MATE family efflux protein